MPQYLLLNLGLHGFPKYVNLFKVERYIFQMKQSDVAGPQTMRLFAIGSSAINPGIYNPMSRVAAIQLIDWMY